MQKGQAGPCSANLCFICIYFSDTIIACATMEVKYLCVSPTHLIFLSQVTLNHSSILHGDTFLDDSEIPSLVAVDRNSLMLTKVDTGITFGHKGIFYIHYIYVLINILAAIATAGANTLLCQSSSTTCCLYSSDRETGSLSLGNINFCLKVLRGQYTVHKPYEDKFIIHSYGSADDIRFPSCYLSGQAYNFRESWE